MANKHATHAVIVERRVLVAATVFIGVGIVLWVVAISTNYWNIVDGGDGIYVDKTGRYFLHSHTGIWTTCRIVFDNSTEKRVVIEKCAYHDFLPTTTNYNHTFLDYQRTVAVFSIISLLLMSMGFCFSLYTFRHTRYMFKRLVAGCHLITAGCVLIAIEVSGTLVRYASTALPYRQPPGSSWTFGFSIMLAWVSFISQVVAAFAFAFCSRKRKKEKAPDDMYAMEEEPIVIGR